MKITIHQPEHLPWIGLFYKIAQAELLVILDNVQFRKNYFGNRNRVMGPQGPAWVTVPVSLSGHLESTYGQTGIAADPRWRKRYLGLIADGYRRHPHFASLYPELKEIVERPWTHVAPLNEELIGFLGRHLGLARPMVRASELDLPEARSTDRLVEICRRLGATSYLAGSQAGSYLEEERFEEAGIRVLHTDFQHPVYPQRGAEAFTSHLSCLDLLMNCGAEAGPRVLACGGAPRVPSPQPLENGEPS